MEPRIVSFVTAPGRSVGGDMKAFASVLFMALVVAACAAPAPSESPGEPQPPSLPPSPTVSSTPIPPSSSPVGLSSPGPSASPSFTVTCLGSPEPGAAGGSPTVLTGCSGLASAVLAAVGHLGYPVRTMTLRVFDFGCGGPFAEGDYSCPLILPGSRTTSGSGYVTFVGTAKVAAVTYPPVDDPPLVVKVIEYQVPPAGWVMP